MVATQVEAVWVWSYQGSTQNWTYGRFPGTVFTKDHLQINNEAAGPIQSLYNLSREVGQKHDLELVWPGHVSMKGSLQYSAGRFVLRWDRGSGNADRWSAPAPWRMVEDPDEKSVSPLRGNGDARTDEEAQKAIKEFNDRGTKAYLLAIKLQGEQETLHVRTYVLNPETDLQFASTELLPEAVQELVETLDNSTQPSCKSAIVGRSATAPEVESVIAKLEDNPNLLLTGPPGTGKSVLLDKIVEYVTSPNLDLKFDPEKIYDAWTEPDDRPGLGKATTVVMHPSYSYDNLVVGLLPKVKGKSVEVGVSTGPLVNLAHYASGGNHALLVLDEFNRGNAAAVLGDVLALLDKDKRDVAHVDLPAFGLPMEVPKEFAVDGNVKVNQRFSLPRSLWIVAAMNSSDRSVAPLDAALRRRFSIVEIGPDYELLSRHLGGDPTARLEMPWNEWTPRLVANLAVMLLQEINDRIDTSLGRDFRLGHSNFWQVGGESAEDALRSLASAWDLRIVQTMRLALQDDDDTLAFILKAGNSSVATENSAQAAWWKKEDPKHEKFARPQLKFNSLSDMSTEALLSELKRLAGA